MQNSESKDVHESVQDYYGKTLSSSDDLKTDACCTNAHIPQHVKTALSLIHDEVMSKYYGCGIVIPESLKGLSVLDLGSGSGRDVFAISKLVGESGHVVGVDMTDEQLDVAKKHISFHAEKFNYNTPNTEFLKGHIEHLDEVGLKDEQFDLIVSNCVINLAKDKESVLREAFRTLKEGGELYFSDVYADRRIPKKLMEDTVLYGECLSGAFYYRDFINAAKKVGFADIRIMESRPLAINNPEIQEKLKGYKFNSITFRLFKINDLEESQENYGQTMTYKGNLEETPDLFVLDQEHHFPEGIEIPVSRNTFHMIEKSRFANNFTFKNACCPTHLGPFDEKESKINFESSDCNPSSGCC